jgi:hypothetical protein
VCFCFPLLIISPLLHTLLSPPHEVCDSPDQVAHYHILASGFISGPTLGWSLSEGSFIIKNGQYKSNLNVSRLGTGRTYSTLNTARMAVDKRQTDWLKTTLRKADTRSYKHFKIIYVIVTYYPISCVCVCMYVYIYIYIYTHTHTHTHIHLVKEVNPLQRPRDSMRPGTYREALIMVTNKRALKHRASIEILLCRILYLWAVQGC